MRRIVLMCALLLATTAYAQEETQISVPYEQFVLPNGLNVILHEDHTTPTVGVVKDHIALGTDFDGFTDPPDDLPDAARLPLITEKLLQRGVPEPDIKKILGGNAQRVLETGWH